jgi:NAD(P)-dependent dehydrogenase (short-subunit alcohol dehydrogenase family)
LHGKVAAVTGGSSGIGHAIAGALAVEGARVVSLARRFEATRIGAVPAPGHAVECKLDVTDEAAVDARFAELPDVDILVCAAGNAAFGPVHTADVAAVRAMLDTHVIGAFLCARAALRHMRARRRGHIVMIGSHVAQRAIADSAGYTAAKAGQLGLTRVLAEEARPYDVRVTTLLAGATDTPIWDGRPGFDRAKMLRPEDVAGFVVALLARPMLAVEEVVVMPPAGVL